MQPQKRLNWLARWRKAATATCTRLVERLETGPAHWRSAENGSDAHLKLGKRGERVAARHLKRNRLYVLAKNYRCRAGEIDLICSEREMLVFVEVKTRTRNDLQDIAEVVAATQWRRIENAARYFLAHPAAKNRPYRFDLVTVLWPAKGKPLVEHLPDAYRPVSR